MDTTRASLRQLLRAGIDPVTLMPLAAELLHRVTGAFSVSLIRVDDDCAPRELFCEYFDEESHRLFAAAGQHFSAATNDPAALQRLLKTPGAPVGTLIRGEPAFYEGATYQNIFKRNGIHHVLEAAIRDSTGPLGILGLFREERARPFTAADVDVVSAFYDDLVHAFRAPILPADFDEADTAIIITSSSGLIEWATPMAQTWLEDASGGPARAALMIDGRLPEACQHLARVMMRNDHDETPTLTLPLPGGRLRLRGYAMQACASPLPGDRIVIELRLELHQTVKLLAGLESVVLTPQLRRVAFAIWRGDTNDAVCTALGISAHTLKSYRKELYARLDVTSELGLLECLRQLAASVSLDLRRHLPARRGAEASRLAS